MGLSHSRCEQLGGGGDVRLFLVPKVRRPVRPPTMVWAFWSVHSRRPDLAVAGCPHRRLAHSPATWAYAVRVIDDRRLAVRVSEGADTLARSNIPARPFRVGYCWRHAPYCASAMGVKVSGCQRGVTPLQRGTFGVWTRCYRLG